MFPSPRWPSGTWLVIAFNAQTLDYLKARPMRKASASMIPAPRFDPCFAVVESYQCLQYWHSSGYPAGAWRYRVSAGTGWPVVSILRLGEIESFIFDLCSSMAVRPFVMRYTGMLLGR